MGSSQFKCLIFLSMLYIGLGFCAELIVYRPVLIGYTSASAGSLISPLWFMLSDVIAELYGYKAAKNMLYCMFIVCFICAGLLFLLIHLPSPQEWHGEKAYDIVLKPLLRVLSASLIGFIVGGFLNIRLLTKWKIMMNGKYFWLRSLGASIIGEIIFTGLGFFIILYGTHFQDNLFSMIFWGVVLKISVNIVFAFPANLLVSFLKEIKAGNIFLATEYPNPFKKLNNR